MASAATLLGDERTCARTRVLLTGTLMTPEGAVQVRLRGVSSAGAQIWAERPIPADCDAVLKRGALFAAARVVWSGDHHAGLRFYRPVELEALGVTAGC